MSLFIYPVLAVLYVALVVPANEDRDSSRRVYLLEYWVTTLYYSVFPTVLLLILFFPKVGVMFTSLTSCSVI